MRDRRPTAASSSIDAARIVDLIREQQPVSAEDLVRQLADVFPAGLADAQRLACVHHQLRHLVDVGQVRNQGSRRYPKWGLAD